MKNLINDLAFQDFKKEIEDFGITEILFINDGDFHTTSDYQLPFELIEKMERALLDSIYQKEIGAKKAMEEVLDKREKQLIN